MMDLLNCRLLSFAVELDSLDVTIFPPTFDPEELRLIEEVTAVADVAEVVGVSIGVDLVSMDMALLKYLFFLRLSLSAADEFPELLSC